MSPLDALGFAPIAADMERVETTLRGSVRAEDPYLSDVAGHLVSAGGKRLRPALAICAAYAAKGLGPVADDAVTGGVSVELVHLGSLYHDDVIDEAETRRGVPSVNARWSNIVAILAGDYLLARASALAASLGADVAALLASTIGELCRGQVLELQHLFDVDRTVDGYTDAISGKTAALFATACRVGGMVSAVDDPTLDALTAFGNHLGMCFQVVDDVLDVTGTDEALGKPAGNDILEGVYTLPVIYALGESDELRDLLGRKIQRDALPRARELVVGTDAVARSVETARAHAASASAVLRSTSALDAEVVDGLTRLVDTLVTREF
ncbi:MAG: polyprenyl synthetase family protein [Acidimicrobiia bacterium]